MATKPLVTISIGTLILSAGLGLFVSPSTTLAAPNHLVINQVQVTGGTGRSGDDFIELFNPTATPMDLKGYRLVKRTASGTSDTTLKSWTTSATIPAYGFYLWANSHFTGLGITADTTTTQTIADDNGLALRRGPENTGTIIDSLSWGKAKNDLVEGSPYPQNPPAHTSLERKTIGPGARQDTGNNAQDFELRNPASPHTSASAPELAVAPGPTPAATQTSGIQPNPSPTKTSTPKILTTSGATRLQGTVAVLPGTFNRTTLFLANPALQVVLSSGDWPKLVLGDQVVVSGTLSHTGTGTKLTLRHATQLSVTSSGEPPIPTSLGLAEVTEEHEAELVTVSGQVNQTSATTFSLTDSTSTVRITLKNRDLAWPKVRPGQQVTVTGIVALSSTGVRLWPRSPSDILASNAPPVQQTIDLTGTKSPNQYPGYLFLGLVVLILGGTYTWEKYKLPSPLQLIKKHLTK